MKRIIAAFILVFVSIAMMGLALWQYNDTQIKYLNEVNELTDTLNSKLDKTSEKSTELETDISELETKASILAKDLKFGQWQSFVASAYSADDPEQGTTNTNALGWDLTDSRFMAIPQIAVDPQIIPLNMIVQIFDKSDLYNLSGFYFTADTGELINGYRVDILVNDRAEALEIGMRKIMVRLVEKGINLK